MPTDTPVSTRSRIQQALAGLEDNIRAVVEDTPPFYIATSATGLVLATSAFREVDWSGQLLFPPIAILAGLLLALASVVVRGTVKNIDRFVLNGACGVVLLWVLSQGLAGISRAGPLLFLGILLSTALLVTTPKPGATTKDARLYLGLVACVALFLLWRVQGYLYGYNGATLLGLVVAELAGAAGCYFGIATKRNRVAIAGGIGVAVVVTWLLMQEGLGSALGFLMPALLYALAGLMTRGTSTKNARLYLIGVCGFAGVYLVQQFAYRYIRLLTSYYTTTRLTGLSPDEALEYLAGHSREVALYPTNWMGVCITAAFLVVVLASYPMVVAMLSASRLRAEVVAFRQPRIRFQGLVGFSCVASGALGLLLGGLVGSHWSLLLVAQTLAGGLVLASEKQAALAFLVVTLLSLAYGSFGDVVVFLGLFVVAATLFRDLKVERASQDRLRWAARWAPTSDARAKALSRLGELLAQRPAASRDVEDTRSIDLLERIANETADPTVRDAALSALPVDLVRARLCALANLDDVTRAAINADDLKALRLLFSAFSPLFGPERSTAGIEKLQQIDRKEQLGVIFKIALLGGWLDYLKLIIEKAPSLLQVTINGFSPAAILVEGNHPEILRIAGERCPECLAQPNDRDKATPAYIAVQIDRLNCLEIIAELSPEAVGTPACDATTPAWAATELNRTALLKLIANACPRSLILQRASDGATPAHVAAIMGHAECLRIIAMASPESLAISNHEGTTPCFIAAQKGHAACLEILEVAAPALFGIDAKKAEGTPAFIAAQNGHAACLNVIGRVCPDTLGRPRELENTTPAWAACFHGHAEALKVVCRYALNSLEVPNSKGETAALVAAQRGHRNCLEVIAEHAPAKLGIAGPNGFTPAAAAAQFDHIDCVTTLLRYARESFKTPFFGNSAAHLAAALGNEECLRRIFAAVPELRNAKNDKGKTPEDLLAALMQEREAAAQKARNSETQPQPTRKVQDVADRVVGDMFGFIKKMSDGTATAGDIKTFLGGSPRKDR